MDNLDIFNTLKICDSHIHISDCKEHSLELINSENYFALSCAHSQTEYVMQKTEIKSNGHIFNSYGVHPQNPEIENVYFLETLLQNGELDSIGETGFDLYTEDLKSNIKKQTEVFEAQLELAIKYNKPVVLHGRKCNDRFFYYSKELSKLPSVMFHSYSGTFNEALSFINKGINCFFTFGKPLLNENKKAIECTANLDCSRLLLETDAPFQTLKGEKYTMPQDIFNVYEKAFELRKIDVNDKEKTARFTGQLFTNLVQFLNKH